MNRPLYFCSLWSQHWKEPAELWTEEQARAADAAGERYAVMIDSPTRPSCIVEVVKETDFVGVYFLDESLRERLIYLFHRESDGRLFLTTAKSRQFEGETDEFVTGTD